MAVRCRVPYVAALERLRKKLNAAATSAGAGAPPPQAFERWRFAAKLAEDGGAASHPPPASKRLDPVIPAAPAVDPLVRDLERAGCSADAAADIAGRITSAAAADAAAVSKLASRLATPGAKKGKGHEEVTVSAIFRRHSVELTASFQGAHFVVLSRRAYGKLALMYRRSTPVVDPGLPPVAESAGEGDAEEDREVGAAIAAAASDASEPGRAVFHSRLFTLLLRYKSIQGYGFQASVGPDVFRKLHQTTGTGFECFASPLNTYFGRYCGAFPDVDAPFGSSGDFFALPDAALKRGCFQANPPFVGEVMTAMATRMEKALRTAEKDAQPLTFIVFVPGWTDEPSWGAMTRSTFLRSHFVVAAGDHGYCDGAAHQRKDAFRTSVYDTGVFVLQSAKAAASAVGRHVAAGARTGKKGGMPGMGRFEEEMRVAMAGARVAAVGLTGKVTKTSSSAKGSKKRPKDDGEEDEEKKKRKKTTFDDGDAEEASDGEGGAQEKEKARGKKEKKEKKEKRPKESKAAKKRRKRREDKAKAAAATGAGGGAASDSD